MIESVGSMVGTFYLKLGRAWAPATNSENIPQGSKGECYRNAFELADYRADLTYCEGFACPVGLIPVHHAWCVDADGRVLDPTWSDKSSDYFGVALDREFVRTWILKRKVWGVLAEHIPVEILKSDVSTFLDKSWINSEASLQAWTRLLAEKFTK